MASEYNKDSNIINELREKIRGDVLKNDLNVNTVFKRLSNGEQFNEIIGIPIDIELVDKVYNGMTDQEIYGQKLLDEGLKDKLGEPNSTARKSIHQAQNKKRLADQPKSEETSLKQNTYETSAQEAPQKSIDVPEKYDEAEDSRECIPGEEETRSCPEGYKGEQKRICGEDGKWEKWDTTNCTPDSHIENQQDQKETLEEKTKNKLGKNVRKNISQKGVQKAEGEILKKTFSQSSKQALSAVWKWLAPLLLTWEFWVCLTIIIVLIVTVILILSMSAKNFSIEAEIVNNNSQFQYNVGISDMKKALELLKTDLDKFRTRIELIKNNAYGINKDKVIKICAEIISNIDEIKKLGDSPEDKGKKTEYTLKITNQIEELWPLINDVVGIAIREIGVCEGSDKYASKEYAVSKRGDIPWCAAFIQTVYKQAGLTIPATNSAPCLYAYMKQDKTKYETFAAGEGTPQPGDIMFYFDSTQGLIDSPSYCHIQDVVHVGIVVENNGNSVKTIEGNTSANDNSGRHCVEFKDRTIQKTFGSTGARYFARIK